MIELLITMVILAISMLGLTALQLTTIRQVSSSKRANEATRLALSRIEYYKATGYLQVTDTGGAWAIPNNALGRPMQNVHANGLTASSADKGPFTVQELIEQTGTAKVITVRVSWLAVTTGATPGQRYQSLSVIMSTHKFQ